MDDLTRAEALLADMLDAYRQALAVHRWIDERRSRYPQSRVAAELSRLLVAEPLIDASPLLCEHGHRPARCEACATAPRSAGPTPEQRAQIRAGIEAGRQATHQLARPHQPNTQEDQA